MIGTTFIYALNDPVTGITRYLGKADRPKERYSLHVSRSRNPRYKSYLYSWIRSLHADPQLELLDQVPIQEWELWEREYIRLFKMINIPLTNLTPGGDGVPKGTAPYNKGKAMSDEQRCKLRAAHLGIRLSAAHRRAQGDGHRGLKQTAEWIRKRMSPQTIEKIRLAGIGRKASPETIEKLRAWQVGVPKSEEHKKKVSIGLTGLRASAETRAKMSASQTARHAQRRLSLAARNQQ